MNGKKDEKIPTTEELREKYAPFNENEGLIRARNWTMPNGSPKTDETAVFEFMANDDEEEYFDQCISILGDMKK